MTERSAASWTSWPPDEKLRLLAELRRRHWVCDRDDCDGLEHEGWEWRHSRGPQRLPAGDWRVWYLRAGRAAGKTRAAAEALGQWILRFPGEYGIAAPNYGDARDVCAESDSGILKVLEGAVESWNRSTGYIRVKNGSEIFLDGADDGAFRLQGHNLRGVWADEIALWGPGWRRAWEESIQFSVRLEPAKIIATGTPKAGHGIMGLILGEPSTVETRMRTIDNAANLDPMALTELERMYEGKRLGRQELEGEIIEDVEGALWTRAQLEGLRVRRPPALARIVVGVDPNISSKETADSAGIVVAGHDGGRGLNRRGYVLADRTVTRGGPRAWGQAAVDAYHEFEADRIVAEANQGGEMVEIMLKTVDPTVPVKLAHASKSKRTRAEPVSSLYEGGAIPPRVFHVGVFQDLEDEMCMWSGMGDSPGRMDALVWALTELMLGGREGGPMRISSPVGATLPGVTRVEIPGVGGFVIGVDDGYVT